jgi:hypothetical protein
MIDRNNISYPPSPPLSTTYMRSTSPNFKNGSTQSDSWYHKNTARGGDSKMLNLKKVIQNYAAHPELLELILSSKVQEDRRRAEEAKLRSKEIDYFIKKQEKEDSILKTQQHHTRVASSSPPPLRYEVVPPSPVENTLPPISSKYYEPRYSVSSASSSESSLLPRLQHQSFSQGLKSHQPASTATNEFPVSHKRNGTSNIDMLLSPVSSPSESKQADFSSSSKDTYEPSK